MEEGYTKEQHVQRSQGNTWGLLEKLKRGSRGGQQCHWPRPSSRDFWALVKSVIIVSEMGSREGILGKDRNDPICKSFF